MARGRQRIAWFVVFLTFVGSLVGCTIPSQNPAPQETILVTEMPSAEPTADSGDHFTPTLIPTTPKPENSPTPPAQQPTVRPTQTVQPTVTATPINTPRPIVVPTSSLTPTKMPAQTSTPTRMPTPAKTPAGPPGGSGTITKAESYCRSRLTQSQQVAYDHLLAGLSDPNKIQSVTESGTTKYQIKVAVNYDATSNLKSELETILAALFMDHPELYYLGKQYSYSCQKNSLTELRMFTIDQNTALSLQSQVENGIRAYQQKVSPYQDQYEIAKQFYELLATNIQYGQDGTDHAYSVAGAFANNLCVCEGFSEAYQLLLNAYGIRAFTVSGDADGSHQWIAMEINGRWYYSDPTWGNLKTYGDAGSYPKAGYIRVSYSYLNLTQAMMNVDRTLDTASEHFTANLNFTATQDNYFVREGGYFQNFQQDAVETYIKAAIADAIANQRETVGIRMESKQAYDALINYIYNHLSRVYHEAAGGYSCNLTYYPGEATYTVHISMH